MRALEPRVIDAVFTAAEALLPARPVDWCDRPAHRSSGERDGSWA